MYSLHCRAPAVSWENQEGGQLRKKSWSGGENETVASPWDDLRF